MFDPHTRPVWHSSLESQSPSSSPQGIPDVQKCSSPRVPVEVSIVGAVVGTVVEAVVGAAVGAIVGAVVGAIVGAAVGAVVVTAIGAAVEPSVLFALVSITTGNTLTTVHKTIVAKMPTITFVFLVILPIE